jgi:hypothetical protein
MWITTMKTVLEKYKNFFYVESFEASVLENDTSVPFSLKSTPIINILPTRIHDSIASMVWTLLKVPLPSETLKHVLDVKDALFCRNPGLAFFRMIPNYSKHIVQPQTPVTEETFRQQKGL